MPEQAVFSDLLWKSCPTLLQRDSNMHQQTATATYRLTRAYLTQVVFWCARLQFHGLLMLQVLEQFWALGCFAIQSSSGQRWRSYSMWMEAFLEVLFCRAPCCHFTDNPTEPFSINLVKLQNSGHRYVAAATSLILELHVHIPIQSACAEIQCTTCGVLCHCICI